VVVIKFRREIDGRHTVLYLEVQPRKEDPLADNLTIDRETINWTEIGLQLVEITKTRTRQPLELEQLDEIEI